MLIAGAGAAGLTAAVTLARHGVESLRGGATARAVEPAARDRRQHAHDGDHARVGPRGGGARRRGRRRVDDAGSCDTLAQAASGPGVAGRPAEPRAERGGQPERPGLRAAGPPRGRAPAPPALAAAAERRVRQRGDRRRERRGRRPRRRCAMSRRARRARSCAATSSAPTARTAPCARRWASPCAGPTASPRSSRRCSARRSGTCSATTATASTDVDARRGHRARSCPPAAATAGSTASSGTRAEEAEPTLTRGPAGAPDPARRRVPRPAAADRADRRASASRRRSQSASGSEQRVPGRRRRPPRDAARRHGHEHRHPRRLRPRLEARLGAARLGRPELLDSYEAERRPVAEHNVARSADPTARVRTSSASCTPTSAAASRTSGRRPPTDRSSTLDLLGPGLTLFTGPERGLGGARRGVAGAPPLSCARSTRSRRAPWASARAGRCSPGRTARRPRGGRTPPTARRLCARRSIRSHAERGPAPSSQRHDKQCRGRAQAIRVPDPGVSPPGVHLPIGRVPRYLGSAPSLTECSRGGSTCSV